METQITEDRFIEFMAMDFPSFKVNKCNLAYPTSDFVTLFYTLMIEAMTSINTPQDQLWNITEEQYEHIKCNQNEGNAFIQHIYSRNVHASVKYIFSQLNSNVPEFRYSDILLPENTPRRTFVFMTFMLNCFYYYINFSAELNDDMIACEEKVQEIRNMKELKTKLIAQLKESEDKKSDHVESLKITRSDILKYTSLNKEKENLLRELLAKHDLHNVERKKLEEKESNLQDELIRLENEVKYFSSLIVSDPDEAAKLHDNMERKKTQCKKKMKDLEKQVTSSLLKLTKFNKVMESQQILNNVILQEDNYSSDLSKNDFRELPNSINKLNGKLSDLIATESGLNVKLTEKETLIPMLKNEFAQCKSDEAILINKGEEACRKFTECIEKQEKSYTQISIKMRKELEDVQEITASIADLNKKCCELEEKLKVVDNETKEKYLWCIEEIKNAFSLIQKSLTN